MITVQINTDRLINQMNSLHAALLGQGQDGDAATVVRDETRRLARTIVNFIPPLRGNGNPKSVGDNAVRRDIEDLVSEANPVLIDRVGSQLGIAGISTWTTGKDDRQIQLKWDHLDPTGDRLEDYHRQYRDPRTGRVPKVKGADGTWTARVVVPTGTRGPFIAKMQKHVGHWKATWAKAGAALGDKYPTWISNHFNSPMALVKVNLEGESPSVTFGSGAAGNGRMAQRIQGAVNARVKAMARRVKLIISGYSKDISSGMKAQNRAKNWSEPQEPML